jgi:putative ABC transport system permease protein
MPGIRDRLQQVDPRQPLYAMATMEGAIARSTAARRFAVVLMASFAGLTLVLAALGVYGTLAQRVAARRRELGVRLALGAVPRQVFRLVLREGALLLAAGVAIGAVIMRFSAPLIEDALFGVTVADATTYAVILVVLAVTTLLASAIPALTASWTDPVSALRE